MKISFRLTLPLVLAAVTSAPAQENEVILKGLAEITGLAMLRPVAQVTMPREKLKAYFDERINEVVKPEEIRLEELALKKLGFAPPEFDLRKTTVDLMAEQAAAFYDYRKKQMVLLEGGSAGMMQDLALVHELAHALADQHFQLEKFIKKGGASDDGSLARMAVMEGQATWLMSEYMAKKMGQSLLQSESIVNMMANMAGAGAGGFPVLQSVPLYMRESLIFPYSQGLMFQHRVVSKLGKEGFKEVFRRAPQSTQEILHPEKYFEKTPPLPARLPAIPGQKDWKKLTEGSVGEFDHKVLLKQYAPSSELLAEQWRGAHYQLWEQKKDSKRVALAYSSQWADDKAAAEFFAAYKDVLAKKWKKAVFSEEKPNSLAGTSEDGAFSVKLEGARVLSLEGLPLPEDGPQAR
jgi:hypothetical protein